MDQVFMAKWDEAENKINLLSPLVDGHHFFETELKGIEESLAIALKDHMV